MSKESGTCLTMQVSSIIQTVLFFCLMGCAVYTDIKKREIPAIIWSLVALISILDFKTVHLFGILVALPLLIAAMMSPTGIGGGDIKLVAAVGLVIGFWKTVTGMAIGLSLVIIFHGVVKLFYRISNKEHGRMAYPLAPFLALGYLCIYFL
ncbi:MULTISPECIES: prepilin peptidase [Clostridia]|uniref:Prepilin peptidase n=1 Tax=Fusibacter paucivorans TaxID=76009 RepID=A0ABS5PPT2_9FIRM|nr:prepilin peptidase [Fusibacter paucivorans]MBS7527073.1 prepilin peptidase [Fusibacter paucivorans]